jgi:biopolymer transport protein ExbD
MRIGKKHSGLGDVKIDMTPMIDIVFQLLIFFILSFKISGQEGDFFVKMPLSAPNAGTPDDQQLPPMKLRLTADAEGSLTGIVLNDQPFQDFDQLHQHIRGLIGDERGPGSIQETAEIELHCDYHLRYRNVIDAVTAVSGYLDANDNLIKLIEKINFASPSGTPTAD